jgi:hypothetical protein
MELPWILGILEELKQCMDETFVSFLVRSEIKR